MAIWWNRFYQCNFKTHHRDQFTFSKSFQQSEKLQIYLYPLWAKLSAIACLTESCKMQPLQLSPHLQAPLTHTLSPHPLKHLKSSVCAVRVNSFCTFFAWFINFENIYVQLFGKRNLKYAATQARVVKQLPPGILTRGPRITDLSDQGDHNWSKQSKWSGQLGDHLSMTTFRILAAKGIPVDKMSGTASIRK